MPHTTPETSEHRHGGDGPFADADRALALEAPGKERARPCSRMDLDRDRARDHTSGRKTRTRRS